MVQNSYKTGTYDNDAADEHGIHQKVAGLREAAGLALNRAAVLVQKVWIKQNDKICAGSHRDGME